MQEGEAAALPSELAEDLGHRRVAAFVVRAGAVEVGHRSGLLVRRARAGRTVLGGWRGGVSCLTR